MAGARCIGQYLIAGDPQMPRSLAQTDKNNWAPRFGIAWKAPAGMVVRGGFGFFFAQDEGFGVSQRPTNNPPFVGFGAFNVNSDQLNASSTIPLSQPAAGAPGSGRPVHLQAESRQTPRRSGAGRNG